MLACMSAPSADSPQRQSDVEVVDGELVKIDRKTKKPATPDRKQHVYSQLLHVPVPRVRPAGLATSTGRCSECGRGLRDEPPTCRAAGLAQVAALPQGRTAGGPQHG
jgi:hypothetical protein